MFNTIAATALIAAALAATPATAARVGGMLGGGAPGPAAHAAATHIAPGGPAEHAPHPGPGAHTRVYGWQGGPHRGHIHHRRGFGVIVGSGYYDGDYYGGCEWLHERAVETGSRYWWRRYEDCVEG